MVVVLVPSLTILDQTVKAPASTLYNPYRKRLNQLFPAPSGGV